MGDFLKLLNTATLGTLGDLKNAQKTEPYWVTAEILMDETNTPIAILPVLAAGGRPFSIQRKLDSDPGSPLAVVGFKSYKDQKIFEEEAIKAYYEARKEATADGESGSEDTPDESSSGDQELPGSEI